MRLKLSLVFLVISFCSCGIDSGDVLSDIEGTLDTTFKSEYEFDGAVRAMAQDSEGNLYIGGDFTRGIIKLDSTGKVDSTFLENMDDGTNSSANDGFNQAIEDIVIYEDKLYVGGSFTKYKSTNWAYFAKLSLTGVLDQSFVLSGSNSWTLDGSVRRLLSASDGGWYLLGDFSKKIMKISSGGIVSTGFLATIGTSFNGAIYDGILQPGDNIIAAGAFTTFQGSDINRLSTLSSGGTLDSGFKTAMGAGLNSYVYSVGRINTSTLLVGGDFDYVGEDESSKLAQVSNGGTLTAISTSDGPNNSVRAILTLSNGNILIGGDFDQFANQSVGALAPLDSDLDLLSSFVTNLKGGATSANAEIHRFYQLSDGKVLVGGQFTEFSGQSYENVVRLK